jgi:GNAT superfamily N-acetyltransferase
MEDECLRLETVSTSDLASDSAWWKIYRDSFPAEERDPQEIITRAIDLGVALASRMSFQGSTIGIAYAHFLTRPRVIFLVYLAIAPAQRRHGFGARLFEFAWTSALDHQTRHAHPPRGMIWEVDLPVPPPDPRIRFFERQGGVLTTQPYIQPPINGPAVPMVLMTRPPMPDIRPIIKSMYLEKYGALNGVPHPILRKLLDSISSPVAPPAQN